MMPQMDGFAVCHKIRQQYSPPIPYILMYTADDREETYRKSLNTGANDLVTKDTPISELAAKIEVLFAAFPLGEA
ncbi:MAG TPA: response regulator [Anaerolineae bacterium]|nr:response regulator [Anaerolineae bacterium]HIP73477.1 response regulator [Anaerolineae bacterium]